MTLAVDRARRHRAIVELVTSQPIANQEALAQALASQGHEVTQSTLSRDLKELRVVRLPFAEGYRYVPAGEEGQAASTLPAGNLRTLARVEVTAVESNATLVIVRTQVARAQGVAAYLDGLGLPELLATVAGDDTVLAVPTSTKNTTALRARLEDLFGLA